MRKCEYELVSNKKTPTGPTVTHTESFVGKTVEIDGQIYEVMGYGRDGSPILSRPGVSISGKGKKAKPDLVFDPMAGGPQAPKTRQQRRAEERAKKKARRKKKR